jgi:hypothetical protein
MFKALSLWTIGIFKICDRLQNSLRIYYKSKPQPGALNSRPSSQVQVLDNYRKRELRQSFTFDSAPSKYRIFKLMNQNHAYAGLIETIN